MTQQHTKGPWSLYEDTIKAEDSDIARVCDGDGIIWNTSLDNREALANAYLIAAAPEMLEALEDFVKYVENEIDLDMININPELQKGLAAIAKAKGQL